MSLRAACVRKELKTGSPACERTLAIYAAMRRQGVEDSVPLPLLYRVKVEGENTVFFQEYLGKDCFQSGEGKAFNVLKATASRRLAAVGVDVSTLSRHLKNWVVAPDRGNPGVRAAYIIDLGNVSLSEGWTVPAPAPHWERS